jgi:hypothetical protein
VRRDLSFDGRRDARIGQAATLIALACLTVFSLTMVAVAVPAVRSRLGSGPGAVEGYRPNDTIDLDPAIYSRATRTVVLFSRFSCGACQASKPILSALVSDLAGMPHVTVVMVTSQAVPEEESLFGRELGLRENQIVRVELNRLRLRVVPTVVVADASGRILTVHEGVLTALDRSEIVQMLATPE